MTNEKLRVTKIGGSNYIIVPSEFVKVFNLKNVEYDLVVKSGGQILIYKMREEFKDA